MSEIVQIEKTELVGLRLAAEHDDAVRELEREATTAKAAWEDAKDESLAAKKAYDQKMNELRKFIAQGPSSQPSLFGMATGVAAAPSWQDKSIDELPFPVKMAEKLHEIGVHTLGQCETLRAGKVAGFPKGAASVDRWGPKKQTEFEEIVLAAMPLPSGELVGDDEVIEDEAAPEFGDDSESNVEATELKVHAGDDSDRIQRIKLTQDITGMEEDGLVAGAEFDAEIIGTGAVVRTADGGEFMVQEFVTVELSEAV
jgi:hypothetical protein